jgi:hypothetical protein
VDGWNVTLGEFRKVGEDLRLVARIKPKDA